MIRTIEKSLKKRHVKQLAHRALSWLRTHEAEFRIAQQQQSALPWQVKPVMELMFLLNTLKRHGICYPILNQLSTAALAEGNKCDWHELVAYDPSAATPLAVVADFFRLHGRPAPFDEGLFELLHVSGFFEAMDRVPYREMDLAHSLGRVMGPQYAASLPVWFASTAFGRRQPLVRYTLSDVYSLTHAIFYLTDLGLRKLELSLDEEMVHRIRQELGTLTAFMLRADNADVVGELILCSLFSDASCDGLRSTIFQQALDLLISSTTKDGAVAPTHDSYRRAESGQGTFAQLYHTTLVGALLFALLSENEEYVDRLVA